MSNRHDGRHALSLEAAAWLLGVSHERVRRWARDGRVRAQDEDGRDAFDGDWRRFS